MQDSLYNMAFERSLLSSILFEPQQFEELGGLLKSDDFYLPAHINVFTAMNILTQKNMPIDEEFIKKELLLLKSFDEQIMLEIMNTNPIANTNAYVKEVKELSKLRKLLTITTTIKRCVVEEGVSSSDTIAQVEKQIMLLEENTSTTLPIDMNISIQNYNNMVEPPLIQLGIRTVDEALCGGIESSQLVHVGGESGIGKTTFTKQVLKNICEKHNVLFFSFEMREWKIAKQFKNNKFRPGSYQIIDSTMMGTDVSDVVRMMRRIKNKSGIRFALIDSKMELSNNHFKGNNDVDRKSDIDKQLARASNDLDMVIFLITQISDENIKNGRMKSYGSSLSDYAADMKILLLEGEDSDVTLSIEKARQDVLLRKKVPLWFNKETLTFTDIRAVETSYTVLPTYGNGDNDKIEVTVI